VSLPSGMRGVVGVGFLFDILVQTGASRSGALGAEPGTDSTEPSDVANDLRMVTAARSGSSPTLPRSRPRVLVDALSFHPADGGFSTGMQKLLSTFAGLKEFDFVVTHHSRFTAWFAKFGMETYPIRFPFQLRQFASIALLRRIARRVGADAVFCENSALPAVGVPGSVTVHDLYFITKDAFAGLSWAQRLVGRVYWRGIYLRSLRHASVVKAVSQSTADAIRQLPNPPRKVLVVMHRVDRPARTVRAWPRQGEPLRIIFVGSLVPRRNLPFLLEAMQHVERDWRLDVVGHQWTRTHLSLIAADPRIVFHGYVSQDKLERFFSECHVIINPAIDEGFSHTIAEAMMRGLLALTSDIPVFREYVPAECRFPIDDPRSLARLIDELDAQEYARLREAGARSVEQFSPAANAEAHRRLLRVLLGLDENSGGAEGPQ